MLSRGNECLQIFKSVGVLDKDYDVVALLAHDVYLFLEADILIKFEGLMEGVVPDEK